MPRLLRSSFDPSVGLGRREVPKIGGSAGGFIALIVCLVVIIMFSCIGVFFLLRNHEPSDQDRATRQRNRRRQHPHVSTSSPFNYSPSAASPQPVTKSRWSSLFGSRSDGAQKHGGRGNPGWVKAASNDWVVEDEGRDGKHSVQSPEMDEFMPHIKSPPIPKFPVSDSTPSIHFEARRSGVQYTPITHSPTSMPMITRQLSSSPQSSLPSFPVPIRSSSPEPIPNSIEDTDTSCYKDERKDSGQSRLSLWTFEGGTKFIESL